MESPTPLFHYHDYDIPEPLVHLTGAGPDSWEEIITVHQRQYAQYTPIEAGHSVVEIGCGIGRDAIPLTNILDPNQGSYVGIDIIHPSIEWCQRNITPKHPNFSFLYFDVHSQIHNPLGTLSTKNVRIPVQSNSVDRIILQSVFTHMFAEDIIHYLKEFNRILKPGGLVLASFFIITPEALEDTKNAKMKFHVHKPLTFEHRYGSEEEGCYINDEAYPEGAVGFTHDGLNRLLEASNMSLAQEIHLGSWSGHEERADVQDICILQKKTIY